jgi:HEAT repeat protein
MNTQQKVINQIKADLSSDNSSIISKALVKTKAKGNEELIEPLVELYKTTKDLKLKQEVKNIFSELKNKDCVDFLLPHLMQDNQEVKELVLFSMWSSGIDMTDYIVELIEYSCDGEYMVILEALTVLENLDGPFNDEDLFQGSTIIQEKIYESKDDKKKELLQSMSNVIQGFSA